MIRTRSLARTGRETSNLQVEGSNPSESSTALCFYTYSVNDFQYILREQRPCTLVYCPTCNCSIHINQEHRSIVRVGYTTARFLNQIWCECKSIPRIGYLQYFFMINDSSYLPTRGTYIRTLPKRVKDIEFINKRWVLIEAGIFTANRTPS